MKHKSTMVPAAHSAIRVAFTDMNIVANTRKNTLKDKPNEDHFILGQGTFIIADGVTRDRINGVYPNPSPASIVSKFFCDSIIESNIKSKNFNIVQAFIDANRVIKNFNGQINSSSFKPGTVGIVVSLNKDNTMSFASIGDCILIVIRDNSVIKLNNKQTAALRKAEANGQKFSATEIRNELCNNPNHPLGYGVLNGNIKAVNFIEHGNFDLKKSDIIVLMTDGLEILMEQDNFVDIIKRPIHDIFDLMEEIERKENIRSDDKTLIRIDYSP